jgi:LDH2 family malate/lactate/ureidoglycolate dehydrogenase
VTTAASTHVVVRADDLHAVVHEAFAGAGLTADDAATIADVLVDANLRGLDSHGVERAPVYLRRVRAGAAGGGDRLHWVAESGATARLDAGHALGPIAAMAATRRAIELARANGAGVVSVGSSSHFGAAGHYAVQGARAGLIAWVASNAARSMAPHGAAEAFLGANPLAVAIPLGRHGEFLLDMSTSIAARGRMRRAQAAGELLPYGLALDAAGAPTTDPAAALAGAVLPAAGPKGSGLAVAIGLMACLLGGADFDDEIASMYSGEDAPQNIGHVLWFIDPSRFGDVGPAMARIEAMIDRLHAVRPSEEGEVLFAGERQQRTKETRSRDGIPVALGELERLAGEAELCGLSDVSARIAAISRGAGA